MSREENTGIPFGMFLGLIVGAVIYSFIFAILDADQTTTPEAITECVKFCEKNEGIDYIKVGENQDGCHCKNKGMLIVEKD